MTFAGTVAGVRGPLDDRTPTDDTDAVVTGLGHPVVAGNPATSRRMHRESVAFTVPLLFMSAFL
jgi:hypothetical protein